MHNPSTSADIQHVYRSVYILSRRNDFVISLFRNAVITLTLSLSCIASTVGADPLGTLFPYEWLGHIAKDFTEPSGIVWHPTRQTLFVVSDEGDIAEITTTGDTVALAHVESVELGSNLDFEGITVDPASGLLYVAVEGDDVILEVVPDGLSIQRTLTLEREYQGRTILANGGQGIEGITFVPAGDGEEHGTLLVSNQSWPDNDNGDVSALVRVRIPAGSTSNTTLRDASLPIIGVTEPGASDMSAVCYDAANNRILVLSDSQNALLVLDRDGTLVRAYAFPGTAQEGLAIDDEGVMYIAQDSGKILKIRPVLQQ
jgi:DNA-binding beta-propeller fold protein YncE